jgi:hypothetical protein
VHHLSALYHTYHHGVVEAQVEVEGGTAGFKYVEYSVVGVVGRAVLYLGYWGREYAVLLFKVYGIEHTS